MFINKGTHNWKKSNDTGEPPDEVIPPLCKRTATWKIANKEGITRLWYLSVRRLYRELKSDHDLAVVARFETPFDILRTDSLRTEKSPGSTGLFDIPDRHDSRPSTRGGASSGRAICKFFARLSFICTGSTGIATFAFPFPCPRI